MIELQNIKKQFEEHVVLEHLNLKIEDGEFVVLSGPSGCGKTTLLHMLGGIENPTSGKVLVNGKDISKKKNLMHFLKNEAAFLFQNFALVDKKTVRKNLEMIPEESRSGISVQEALAYVGLSGFEGKSVYKLSGGEQQRVALARILMKKCTVILADEPTGSLDRKNADMVMDILKNMHSEGKTIVMVTHEERYKNIGDRVLCLAG